MYPCRNWIEKEYPISATYRKAFDDALDVLRDLGATVRHIDLPPILEYNDPKRVIALAELFAIHEPVLRTRPDLFGALLRYRVMGGALVRAEDYVQAMRMRTQLAAATQAAFAHVDVMVLPCSEPAGLLETTKPDYMFDNASWSAPFNTSGNPALSVCSGFNAGGMPFSLQIAGRLFDEATVLRVGDAYEKATQWRARRPDIADLERQSAKIVESATA
jgi:aspartyl-tRNA(Asn)/glutamyl-tRNA(Gln) amidotransferase subunit A